MKFFPSGMPKPLQSGYTSKHSPNILRTQMSDGYCRQRLVNQGAPDTVSVSFVVSETQYRDFLSWFKADIQCGASWFVMYRISLTLDVSNTIVDDGSWEDHYLPAGSTDDEFGFAETTEGARIADIDSVIEEDVDTGAGIGNVTTTESADTWDEV